MKKFYYALALATLCGPMVHARMLSVEEAKANISSALGAGMKKAPALGGSLELAQVIAREGTPTLYLFTGADRRGLVVASASSETATVLGYADCGEFDLSSMPPSMQALLDDYSREIAQAEAGEVRTVFSAPAPEREAIEPLCKTQWNQNAPYNDLTPSLVRPALA